MEYEVGIHVFNRTSIRAYLLPTPRGDSGQPLNGWDLAPASDQPRFGSWMLIPARSWDEYGLTAPMGSSALKPSSLHQRAQRFTLTKGGADRFAQLRL